MNMIGLLLSLLPGFSPASSFSVVSHTPASSISHIAASGVTAAGHCPRVFIVARDTTPPDKAYQPEHFTDRNRTKRIESAFHIIENIYREYVEENKIPGFAFGITGDGELLHTGAFGYTSTDK